MPIQYLLNLAPGRVVAELHSFEGFELFELSVELGFLDEQVVPLSLLLSFLGLLL